MMVADCNGSLQEMREKIPARLIHCLSSWEQNLWRWCQRCYDANRAGQPSAQNSRRGAPNHVGKPCEYSGGESAMHGGMAISGGLNALESLGHDQAHGL